MKYGQIIKPEDIPGLVQLGELRFGELLEFYDDTCDQWTSKPHPFYGVNTDQNLIISPVGDFPQARFPLPALKDGDPVLIRDWDSKNARWLGRIFKDFHFVSGIHVYADGRNRWTFGSITYSANWRLPTKKELQEAGLDGWYDGRIELEEG